MLYFFFSSELTNHCHTVVEERLSKHQDEEDLVHMDLLKHGDDGHRVHSSNQTAKEKILQEADVQVTYNHTFGFGFCLADTLKCWT